MTDSHFVLFKLCATLVRTLQATEIADALGSLLHTGIRHMLPVHTTELRSQPVAQPSLHTTEGTAAYKGVVRTPWTAWFQAWAPIWNSRGQQVVIHIIHAQADMHVTVTSSFSWCVRPCVGQLDTVTLNLDESQ
jgi:hypothetical protein